MIGQQKIQEILLHFVETNMIENLIYEKKDWST